MQSESEVQNVLHGDVLPGKSNFAKDLYFQSTRPATLKALKSAALGGFFVLSVSYELEWQSLLYNEQHI